MPTKSPSPVQAHLQELTRNPGNAQRKEIVKNPEEEEDKLIFFYYLIFKFKIYNNNYYK
jgi:hypothetical protein